MKLSKIAKLVIKSGRCDVYSTENGMGVYISTGYAIYRVDSLPVPDIGDQMLAMLDVPEKKREDIVCNVRSGLPPLDMTHTACGEMMMTEYKLMTGSNYLILVDEHSRGEDKKKGKLAFVNEELLAPLRGEEKEYIGYACRFTADGKPYIIVKDGMYAIAAVLPELVNVEKVAAQMAQFQSICLEEVERGTKDEQQCESAGKTETE